MKLFRNVALSRKALLRHGVRTTLAMTGTAVGVASIVATVAVGRGAEHAVIERINALGRDMLMIYAGQVEQTPTRAGTAGASVTTLNRADSDAILASSPAIAAVAPEYNENRPIKRGMVTTTAYVRGTTPEYEEIRDFRTVLGRYFTHAENQAAARVTVIGSQVRDVLFPDTNPLNQWLRVGRIPFRVIGVLESKGVSVGGGATEDDQILVPIKTAQRRVFNVDWIKSIYLQVVDAGAMATTEREIAVLLRQRHQLDRLSRTDDFNIENPRVLLAAAMETAASFRRMITGLGAVTLIVSGVGILSLMTLSVRERRGEVGLRIAVGARRRDVLTQFLLEALAIAVMGGLLGLVLGIGSVAAIRYWTEWSVALSVSSVAMALTSALVVGGLFGVYPAHRAASWHPVTALRAE